MQLFTDEDLWAVLPTVSKAMGGDSAGAMADAMQFTEPQAIAYMQAIIAASYHCYQHLLWAHHSHTDPDCLWNDQNRDQTLSKLICDTVHLTMSAVEAGLIEVPEGFEP